MYSYSEQLKGVIFIHNVMWVMTLDVSVTSTNYCFSHKTLKGFLVDQTVLDLFRLMQLFVTF